MNSIRQQLTTRLLGLFVALQGAGLLAIFLVARNGAIEEFDDALRAKALAVSKLIVETPAGVRTDGAAFYLGVDNLAPAVAGNVAGSASYERFLNEFRQHAGRHNFFELWDAGGRRLAKSDSLGEADLPRRVEPENQLLTWDFPIKNEPARGIEFVFRPDFLGTRPREARSPEVQLVVAAEREALDEKLVRLEFLTVTCGVLLLGATLWVMPAVLRRGLQPLDRLGEEVARIDAGSLWPRAFPPRMRPGNSTRLLGG